MATTLRTSGIQMGSSILDVSGSAPSYPCRAWVNFNGTGTPAVRASGNVSSITRLANGDYRLNFTTAMADANYAVNGMVRRSTINNFKHYAAIQHVSNALQTTSCRVQTQHLTIGGEDAEIVCIQIFR